MLMLTTIVEMKGLSSSHLEEIWNEQLKSMMGTSFKGEKSSALKIAMVVRNLNPGQEVGPDPSLDQDLDPRGGPLQGAEVAPDPSQEVDLRMQRTVRREPNPDPSLEVDPRMQRTVRINTVAPDPGQNQNPSPEVDPRM
jgi:hypothetical protein